MATFQVILGEKPTEERTPIERLKDMNLSLYAALKVHKLTAEQRILFNRLLGDLPLPECLADDAVIASLADPEDPMRDFERMDPLPRGRMVRLMQRLGIGPKHEESRDEVKRRIGLVQRVITHARNR
ncbi:hypothetical protein A2856_01000 [Candidatus Uhrbacteria bacterium RIFCSPHIGHO2_01_FULL_63_20]|uniref:Uncharacterized protein n=1 Tax=Candidatus Uhrbacteria bacterium RIFCSPHIGHO2_01_FULL_63_20 TaxID=1802385 RepID=A0A1F7TNF5_9BACT|nr:MAG: hypothetical protein A2856_01000 [Candidatus Uhrbacteria bacterium RIFCSPHIGHO2_01_FULL_63_20]